MNLISTCPTCSKIFIKNRVDKVCCSVSCSSAYNRLKKLDGREIRSYTKRGQGKQKKEYKKKENTNVFKEVQEYIMYMKSKSYYADYVDLFKLVHVYDLVYPNLTQIPNMRDVEKSSDIMFAKICVWYKNKLDSELGL
jgi:hypothetical protein